MILMFIRFSTVLLALLLTFSALANENFSAGITAYLGKAYFNAFTLFTKAANQGHAGAQYNLGLMYAAGRGVKQDYAQAVAWYQKAANQGYANAQYNLGVRYANGQGVKQDYAQAVAWYQKAANQGDADAQYNLGVMYANGQGVKQDYAQAVAWYQKAANQGHVNAQYNLGLMYGNGRGVKQDYAQAVAWYQKAANQGYADAQHNLGVRYANGQGVKQDDAQAVAWYQKAANQGDADAQGGLGFMYANGRGVKKDLTKALALYKKSNTMWSRKKYVTLDKIMNCDKKAKTQLFNVNLKCANRNTLMAAAKQAGATVKLEDKGKWGDKYLTSKILKGSSELSIDYTVDGFFAQAKYTFPSRMDAAQASKVKSFVANKYGKPDTTKGNTSVGKVKYQWKLEDGIELNVSRGWPDTTTYLTYVYPENFQAMKTEQDKQKKAREAKQYESQGNAF
jgi:TPR repeat protein